jgi:hypothetical protein
VEHVPAIGAELLARGGEMLREQGVWSLFAGMLRGMPYKIFAIEAPHSGIGIAMLLAVTVPARLVRFLLVSTVTHLVARRVLGAWSHRAQVSTLLGCWAAFYAVYFALH